MRDRAIILKTTPFREEDAWIVAYGHTQGKMEAIARGVRRLSAKHVGHLQPFAEVELMIAKGAEYDKVAVARMVHPRPAIRQSLSAMGTLGASVSLIERLTKPGVADDRIFFLCRQLADALVACGTEFTVSRARLLHAGFALQCLDALGFAPELDRLPEVSGEAVRVLTFLRERSFPEVLRLTLDRAVLLQATEAIERHALAAALEKEPPGSRSLLGLLS